MEQRIMHSKKVGSTDGTWAQGVRKGNLLYISGQIGCDEDGNTVGLDFESQAIRTLDNLMDVLETAGGKPDDLVSITVYLRNMEDRPTFAKIRRDYFEDAPPASTVVGVTSLCSPELLIEVNGVAVL